MKKIIKLTESDLARIVRRVLKESQEPTECISCITTAATNAGIEDK